MGILRARYRSGPAPAATIRDAAWPRARSRTQHCAVFDCLSAELLSACPVSIKRQATSQQYDALETLGLCVRDFFKYTSP